MMSRVTAPDPDWRRERSKHPRSRLVRVKDVVNRLMRAAAALIAATAAAELVLTPITAALFARVTFAGLLLNFVAIPLMALVQAVRLRAGRDNCLPGIARACGYVVHLAASGLIDSARLVDVAALAVTRCRAAGMVADRHVLRFLDRRPLRDPVRISRMADWRSRASPSPRSACDLAGWSSPAGSRNAPRCLSGRRPGRFDARPPS